MPQLWEIREKPEVRKKVRRAVILKASQSQPVAHLITGGVKYFCKAYPSLLGHSLILFFSSSNMSSMKSLYSSAEDQAILEFISKHDLYAYTGGNDMWMKMAKECKVRLEHI